MDADRFDRFTLSLAEIGSRRGILGAVGAGLSGLALLAGVDVDAPLEAGARKKKRKRKGKGKGRGRKKKKCKGGKTKCSGKCRDLSTNDNHCGNCDNACDPDETCQNGSCQGNGCQPDCQGATCGDSDGCGGVCDGACPPGAAVVCNNGTCECDLPGACCFDSECAVNRECRNVNGSGFCFCKPGSVPCGNPVVCCDPGQVCNIGSGACSL